jgi:hypothetical protein
MGKIVTIHQPNYLPWIGLFSKIGKVDCFVIGDDLQYVPIVKRNKIRVESGGSYLTVPVGTNFNRSRIREVTLPEDRRWQQVHWETIRHHYSKSPFFNDYKDFFEDLYRQDFHHIWEINEKIIRYLLDCFGIRVEVLKASELYIDPNLHQTDWIMDCTQKAGAETYLSGPSGRNYLETAKFSQYGLGVKFFKFRHPVYPQRYPGFEPNLSAIDLLFNVGPCSGEVIRAAGDIEN